MFVNMVSHLESRDFLLAKKYGYLGKKSKTWYKSWTERFYVLSNIGLVYMEKPTDKEIKLFPFIDFEIESVPEKKYNKKYAFNIKTIKGGDFDMVLQAYSEMDYKEWMDAFKAFKKELSDSGSKALSPSKK